MRDRVAVLALLLGLSFAALNAADDGEKYWAQWRGPYSVPLVLMAIATLAALVPARQAMLVDPLTALRIE